MRLTVNNFGDFLEGIVWLFKVLFGFWWWSPEEDIEKLKESNMSKPGKIFLIILIVIVFFLIFGFVAALGIIGILYDKNKNLGIGILVVEGIYIIALIWKLLRVLINKKKSPRADINEKYNTDQLVEMEQRRLYKEKYRRERRRFVNVIIFIVLLVLIFICFWIFMS